MIQRLGRYFLNPSPIIRAGHPTLHAKSAAIKATDTVAMEAIVKEMTRAFESKLSPVVGLAAPQLGHAIRLIAYQVQDAQTLKEYGLPKPIPLTFLMNPVISNVGSKVRAGYEFCESIPNYSGVVKRPDEITVTATNLEGKRVSRTYSGLVSRIIQHEIDHLDGICFVDKMEKGTLRHDKYVGIYDKLIKS